jgi:hypothetical protein
MTSPAPTVHGEVTTFTLSGQDWWTGSQEVWNAPITGTVSAETMTLTANNSITSATASGTLSTAGQLALADQVTALINTPTPKACPTCGGGDSQYLTVKVELDDGDTRSYLVNQLNVNEDTGPYADMLSFINDVTSAIISGSDTTDVTVDGSNG